MSGPASLGSGLSAPAPRDAAVPPLPPRGFQSSPALKRKSLPLPPGSPTLPPRKPSAGPADVRGRNSLAPNDAPAIPPRRSISPNSRTVSPHVASLVARRTQTQPSTKIEIALDPFVLRQFSQDPSFTGQRINCDPQEFEDRINHLYEHQEHEIIDGHAHFCKHIFFKNFIPTLMPSVVPITPENKDKMMTSYEERSAGDLPVLVRWFLYDEIFGPRPMAQWIEVIVYHQSHVTAVTGNPSQMYGIEPTSRMKTGNGIWRVVSIKGQDSKDQTPMLPVTLMRNALPRTSGGCDFPIDPDLYMKSVLYWETHCTLRDK